MDEGKVRSIEVLKEGCDKHPTYVPLLLKISEMLLAQKEYEAAYKYSARGAKLDQENCAFLYNIGIYFLFKKKYQNCIKFTKKVLVHNPMNYKAWKNIGTACRKIGKLEESILAYERCIKIAPSFHEAYLGLGKTYVEKQDLLAAAKCFHKIISKGISTLYSKLYRRGYDELIEDDSVIKMLEKYYAKDYLGAVQAIEQDFEKNVIVNYHLGEGNRFIGKIDKAVLFFRKVLIQGLDPETQKKKLAMHFVSLAQARVETLLGVHSRSQASSNSRMLSEGLVHDRSRKVNARPLKTGGITLPLKTDSPVPVSIIVIKKGPQAEQIGWGTESNGQIKTAKNSLADQPPRTNSFYQALCAANKLELALEQRYCTRPDTRTSEEKVFDSHVIGNYLNSVKS